MSKLSLFLTLTIIPFFLSAASIQSQPTEASLTTASSTLPFQKHKKAKVFKAHFKKRKKDKKPFAIMGYEPFTVGGMTLLIAGIFIPILLPLGLLSLLFGFLRYDKLKPETFKGDKKHKRIFIAGLILPVLAFLGIHAVKGRP